MLHLGPAVPPSPAPATQALGRKSLGSHVSWAGPAGSGRRTCSPSYSSACPPGQSAPTHYPTELQPDLAGRTQPHHSHLSCHHPSHSPPRGLIPGRSAGCISSLAAESMAGPGAEVGMGMRVWVRVGRVDAHLSCSLCLGPSENEEGSPYPAPSGNETEVGVLGRHLRSPCLLGFSVLPQQMPNEAG